MIGRLPLISNAPLETVYRSAPEDNVRGVGFAKGGFFSRKWLSSEHWGSWEAKDLGLDWETRLSSHELPLGKE